jgi:hypothetical protein
MTAISARYLIQERALSATIIDWLIDEGKLYADQRGKAVFLMVTGRPNRPIGAELRGTGDQLWRGLAPGTRRNAGYLWVGPRGTKQIVLRRPLGGNPERSWPCGRRIGTLDQLIRGTAAARHRSFTMESVT